MKTLTGISSMATRHLLADLAAATEAAGLARVNITSIGGVTAAERIAAGEPFDIAILDQDALRALADDGHVNPTTVRPLVVSPVGIAVPADGNSAHAELDTPAFPHADGLIDALLRAPRIGYSTGPSGLAVLELIRTLGIYDGVADRLVQARPGIPVATLVSTGEVGIGFQQLSELLGVPGVRVLGLLPPGLSIASTFSAAITTVSANPDVGSAILAYWDSPAVEKTKITHHFTPTGGSREH